MNSATLVQKLWNYCNVLRDDGMSYGDYVEQLTYANWHWDSSQQADGRYRLSGRSGKRSITLHLQQPFSYSALPSEPGFWSISAQLIPDIVLVVRYGEQSSWLVLDAKYRRKRSNVLDGMRSAHLYRDALRRFTRPPAMSLLLIPAPSDDVSWIFTKEFREAHGVGALVFSPGQLGTAALERFLDDFFG